MANAEDRALREQLVAFLRGGQAHADPGDDQAGQQDQPARLPVQPGLQQRAEADE